MYGEAGDRHVSSRGLTANGHTAYRSDGIGLAASAMHEALETNFGSHPITKSQMWAMATDAATLANAMGYSKVTDKEVQTHGEAGSGTADNDELYRNTPPDYAGGATKDPDNYGPSLWGGAGARWDLDKLEASAAIGTGGPIMRKMINSELAKFHEGGEVPGSGEISAKLLGGEIVIDRDSSITKATPMLLAINAARDEKGVMKAISDYAPYEAIKGNIVPYPIVKMVPVPMPSNSGGVVPIPMGGSAGGSTTEVLAAIG